MNNAKTERVEVYAEITNAVIQAIESGAGTYEMPWNRKLANQLKPLAAIPVNAASGQSYRGANVLALWMRAQARGYATNFWATYKQWDELGAQVREGRERYARRILEVLRFRRESGRRRRDGYTGQRPTSSAGSFLLRF